MMYINKNSTNYIYPSVTELTTLPLSAVNYLFEFISQNDKISSYYVLPNISTTDEYDKFLFIESSTGNTLTAGDYLYNIYQQTSTININPLLTQSKVETGLLSVTNTGSTTLNYNKDGGSITYKFAL